MSERGVAEPAEVWIDDVYKVLGWSRSAPDDETAPGGPGRHRPVLPLWQSAKDNADGRLLRLSDTLRISAHPEAVEVADEVAALLEPLRVRMVTALTELDRAPSDAGARQEVILAIAAARDWLASDPRVAAIDANPWGVDVGVAAVIGAALGELDRAVSEMGN